ncbi:MAG: hypothetical protein CO099_08845 [Bdellovibrio sp. CG_4_9_14_3_um_filter_39_7]|nr:MAG: hypothetical protein CO099_08845 [Bdellovibrio sp. CG_4_9_14_3_um_filter_39_7]
MKKSSAFLFLISLVGNSVDAKGLLEYRHYQRINTPSTESAQDNTVGVQWEDGGHWRKFQTKAVGAAEINTKNSSLMISASEFYVSYIHSRTELDLGRKILPWNEQEGFWGLGEINPMRGFSWLETEREGIMGLHFRRKQWLEVGGFVSPINIPQINPSFTNKNGKVEGLNEWAKEPPRIVRFRNTDIPVYYEVEYPKVEEVIFHPAAGLDIGKRWDNARVVAYGAYKPENQIRVNATGFYEQTATVERAYVRTRPFIAYHQIIGGGTEVWNEHWNGKVFYDTIRPIPREDNKFVFESLRIEPTYEPEHYLTASVGRKSDFISVELNALVRTKGKEDNTTAFGKIPKWERAIGMEAKWSMSDRFNLRFMGRRDIKKADVTLHTEVEWRIKKHLWVQLGLEMIDSPQDTSFWSSYRTNDTVTTSLGWLF